MADARFLAEKVTMPSPYQSLDMEGLGDGLRELITAEVGTPDDGLALVSSARHLLMTAIMQCPKGTDFSILATYSWALLQRAEVALEQATGLPAVQFKVGRERVN